jgi:cytochrome c
MDSFELNKLAGAVLGSLLFVMLTAFVSDVIVYSPAPKTPGYALPEPQPVAAAAPVAAAPAEPIGVRLASADVGRGEAAFKKCAACHTNDRGGASRVGPAMWNLLDRPKAAVAGFAYSDVLKSQAAAGGKWDFASLDGFIANPRGYAPGTKMAFAGIASPKERADLLAYLRSLADAPVPLPTN